MNKDVAIKLKTKAEEIAKNFSNTERQGNFNKETFTINKIIPLGEYCAAIIFDKSSGKRAICYAFYIQKMDYWNYFFVSYGHLSGLERLRLLLQEIEEFNFENNFKDDTIKLLADAV